MEPKKEDHPYYQFLLRERELAKPDAQYVPPSIPFPIVDEADFDEIPPFGKEFKNKHFMLDPNVAFIQHGSYGATLKVAMKCLRRFQDHMESQPCSFMNEQLMNYLVYAIREMAKFVIANAEDVVFVPNATTGFNTVMKSLQLKPEDTILSLSLGYDAVTNTIKHGIIPSGARSVVVNIPFPLERETIIQKVQESISPSTRLVVVDHITSGTGILMPVEEIVKECRSRGVPVFVDGAHAVGQVPLNLNELDPDFYVSNCHKWLCSPKGIAFLRVRKEHQKIIHPLVISHGYEKGFQAEFMWTATMDYCSFLSMFAVLEFWNRVGPQKIMDHNHKLVGWAAKTLAKMWGTDVLVDQDNMYGSMAEVRLPNTSPMTGPEVKALHDTLVQKYKVQTVLIPIQDKVYARLSAQIYNDESDYIKFGEAIKEIFAKH